MKALIGTISDRRKKCWKVLFLTAKQICNFFKLEDESGKMNIPLESTQCILQPAALGEGFVLNKHVFFSTREEFSKENNLDEFASSLTKYK